MRLIVRTRGEPAALAAFLDSIRGDPAITLVDTIGPAGQAHTAVIEVADDAAAALEARLRPSVHLIVERDRPLSPQQ